MLQVTGKTSDGREVVAGTFRFYETHGLPLDVLFEALKDQGRMPDWVAFYHEARHAGRKPERILSTLGEAVSDVWGPDFRDTVIQRLTRYDSLVQEAIKKGGPP